MPPRNKRGLLWTRMRRCFATWILAGVALSCAHAPPRASRDEAEQMLEIVRLEAAGGTGSEDVFRDALHSEAAAVRARATRALVRTLRGPRRELEPFVTLLASDADAAVRREAAFALGALADAGAAPYLKASTVDADPLVGATAVQALSRIKDAQPAWFTARSLDANPLVRREAILAAARLADPTLPRRLPEMIGAEKDERVRWALYWALARAGAALPEMRRHLAKTAADPNFLVAAYALEALGASGGTEGVEEILAVAGSGKALWIVKEAATRTLASYLEHRDLDPTDRSRIEAFLPRRRPRMELAPIAFSGQTPGRGLPEVARALSPLLSRSLRNSRAEVRIAGRGAILLELFVLDAPVHVAAFAELARTGYFSGLKVESVDPLRGVLLTSGVASSSVPGALAGSILPEEAFPGSCHRGTVLSAGGIAGSLFISHMPLPEVEGAATCWGKVALGMEVLDLIEEGDLIQSVTILDSTGLPLSNRGASGS